VSSDESELGRSGVYLDEREMGREEGSLDESELGKSEVCSEARELARSEVYSDKSELQQEGQEFPNERTVERERLAYVDGTVVAIVTRASPLAEYWRSRRKRRLV